MYHQLLAHIPSSKTCNSSKLSYILFWYFIGQKLYKWASISRLYRQCFSLYVVIRLPMQMRGFLWQTKALRKRAKPKWKNKDIAKLRKLKFLSAINPSYRLLLGNIIIMVAKKVTYTERKYSHVLHHLPNKHIGSSLAAVLFMEELEGCASFFGIGVSQFLLW